MYRRILVVITVCWLVSAGIGSAVPSTVSSGPDISRIGLHGDPLDGSRLGSAIARIGPTADPCGCSPEVNGTDRLRPTIAWIGPYVDPQGWPPDTRYGTRLPGRRLGPTIDPQG